MKFRTVILSAWYYFDIVYTSLVMVKASLKRGRGSEAKLTFMGY